MAGGDDQFGAGIEDLIPFGDQGLVALWPIQADAVESAAAAAAVIVFPVGRHFDKISGFNDMAHDLPGNLFQARGCGYSCRNPEG